jgi:hypothetical protein
MTKGIGRKKMPVSKGKAGVAQEMHKFKMGKLHSGSKHGPIVNSRKQAIAISMSEAGLSRKNPSGPMGKMSGTCMKHSAEGKMGIC